MLFKHKTAVRPRRNIVGKPFKGFLSIEDVTGRSADDIRTLLELGYELPFAGGATSPQNTVMANPIYVPKAIVASTDQTINQGDLVWWDPINFTLKALSSPGQVAVGAAGGFVGAAQGSANPNVYPDPAAGAPSEHMRGIVVQRGGTVRLHSTTGDGTYFPFEPVTVGADAQTITRGGQTSANRVGFVIVPVPVNPRGAPGATPAPETVAGGTDVEVWLEPKFPTSALL